MCYDLGYYLSDAETDIAFRTIDLYVNASPSCGVGMKLTVSHACGKER